MIPAKTPAGLQVLKDRSAADLTPRQRTALILIDGKRRLADVLSAGATSEDIERLFDLGLVTQASSDAATVPAPLAAVPTSKASASPQERYAEAYPIASRLTAGLGLRGFRLNLAVEAAAGYDDLVALSGKIREAVGAEKFEPLALALALGQR
jgi:hypothetical protein